MAFGGVYKTGTLTVDADGTTFSGTGTAWQLAQIEPGDLLYAGGTVAVINAITDDTTGALETPWAGADLAAAPYVILKTSWTRYDPALTQAKLRSLLASVQATSIMYAVAGSAPDVGLGEDGQYALKTTSSSWRLWLKVSGEWVEQNQPAGIKWRGAWSSATAYVVNDVVSSGGKTWISILDGTNKSPASQPTYWQEFVVGGDRYDLASFDTDRPASGELIVKIYPKDVTFYAGLLDSQSGAEVAATAESVFSLTKNGTEFATITFAAASATGVFACAADTAFADGDVLRVYAPSPRDATLAGVASSIVGYR